jgi:hypothetical protein
MVNVRLKIHLMLFLMGSIQWLAELVAWYFGWDGSIWYWVTIDLTTLIQSILIFNVFVFGRNALANLEDKYSIIKRKRKLYIRPKAL